MMRAIRVICSLVIGIAIVFSLSLPAVAGSEVISSFTVPLTISNVSVSNIGVSYATISWQTNGNTTSQVFYDTVFHGNTADYAYYIDMGSILVTHHIVPLTGLTPSTTYHYRVKSEITTGGYTFTALSADLTFTTGSTSSGGGGSNFFFLAVTGLITGNIIIDSNGTVLTDTVLTTPDGKLYFRINAGTQLLDSSGRPLTSLSVTIPSTMPPSDGIIMLYEFSPGGASLVPPGTLTMRYDQSSLPPGISEDSLYIAYWDGSAWQPLPSTVNLSDNTVSALILQFGIFALFYTPVSPTTTTTTPIPTTITTPPPTTTTTTQPAGITTIDIILPDGTSFTLRVGPDNRLIEPFTVTSSDGKFSLNFYAGTRITTSTGEIPDRIVINNIPITTTDADGSIIRIYEVIAYIGETPVHVDFTPPVMLTLQYDVGELPDGTTAVYLVYYGESSGTWIKMEPAPGYVAKPGELATLISHLSLYGIKVDVNPPVIIAPKIHILYWLIPLAVVLIVILVFLFILIRRRRKKKAPE